MARFSFRKRASEDEGIPPEAEPGAEMDMTPPEEIPEIPEGGDEGGGRSRRILIIAGIGIILIGGYFLANQLFLTPPPAPPAPARPAVPAPAAKAPAPPAPTKEAAPIPPAAAKAPAAPPTKEATPTPPMPAKVEAKPATPAPAPSAGPIKPEAGKVAKAEKTPMPPKAEAPAPAKSSAAPPKAEHPAGAKAAPAAPASYSLQVAAMVVEENAEGLKQKLDASGFQSVIRKGTAFLTKHVVTVGEPTGKREAEDLARRLTVDGFPSQLLAASDKYTVQIGAFFNLDEAIDLARELQKKNYHPKITETRGNAVVFQVRHGKFDSRTAAVKRGEQLKAKGFNPVVVRD